MAIDTKGMLDLVDASPGDQMVMEKRAVQALLDAAPGDRLPIDKSLIRTLLNAVDLGRVTDQLAGVAQTMRSIVAAV